MRSFIFPLLFIIICCQEAPEQIQHPKKKESSEGSDKLSKSFQEILDLEAYQSFKKVYGQALGNTDLALTYLQKDSLKVLVLEEIIGRSADGKAYFIILEEVRYIHENSKDYIPLCHCDFKDKKENSFIISLVKDEESEYYKNILKTWMINPKTKSFEEIDPVNVRCLNEWFGYDG